MSGDAHLAAGEAALAQGEWRAARAAFEGSLGVSETAAAHFGLANALWWLGENIESVDECSKAYALFRRAGATEDAVQCALWLAITYKANFANYATANGWLGRADRLLETVEHCALHGFAAMARAYRMPDLERAEELTCRALDVARATGDIDLELGAISQLGLIRVGKGRTADGFALIDEALAAALGGERSTFDTVVYTCCDMLNACELTSDVERATQWCRTVDRFVEAYGCPFLFAECRIAYGSVLTATGRWTDAERELDVGLRITKDSCPALHDRGLIRLASLRIRQGRLEEAEALVSNLGRTVEAEREAALAVAALWLARGDAAEASHVLARALRSLSEHRTHLCSALDVFVDATLAGGDLEAAAGAAARLATVAAAGGSQHLLALSHAAAGRVAAASDDAATAAAELSAAVRLWSALDLPFELARTRLDLACVLAGSEPDTAVDHARRSFQAFDDLGASSEADRAAAFLRSIGVVVRTGPKRVGVLTVREQEVLRLLGSGLSNPEIASRLHVSPKTASHHVSSVLSKLHLRNRAEAAVYAERFGSGR